MLPTNNNVCHFKVNNQLRISNLNIKKQIHFKTWRFGTINIRSGKEKDEGAKIYSICKLLAKTKLNICFLQEVKYRNCGSKLITIDTGEKYEFHWCGMKKRREAGVGSL